MAASYQVDENGRVFTVVDEITTRYWAVITGEATDEIFGALNAPGFVVELVRADLATKALANGLYAITGYPGQSFPQLSTTSYNVDYVLTAPGFRDLPLTVTVPTHAVFPVAAPASAMRRLPVRIQGRVVSGTTRLPISDAVIASVDPATPPAVHVSVLRSPLYFAHASGATAQAVTIGIVGGAGLTGSVTGGDKMLNLSVRTGLAAGSLVRLTSAGGVLLEYGVVDHLGPGSAGAAGQVFLRHALNRSYPVVGTAVDFVDATPTGPGGTLFGDADAGDGVLLASELFGGTVAVESGGALAEFHELGAVSDGNGYYGLDGMGRVQELFLQATQGALQGNVDWFVEYDQPLNLVDFRL
ncbi:MAG TPA: hypothetical protein VHZ52_06135 [Acidobacteriaceae bacterium]|nr:hypothetical protein [Acidobacteriaceae bacterium]